MSHKFLNPVEVDGQVSAEYLDLSTTTTHSVNAGEIAWNSVDGTFDIGLLNGVTLQAGQEIHFYGKATEVINNGNAVQFAGVQGDHILIKKAVPSEINANPEYFMGIATQNFATNDFGYVTAFGNVRELNTTSYSLGDVLYYASSGTSGLLTNVKPTAPNAKIIVAAVVRVHATQGVITVRPHVMPKVVDLQDVNSSSLTNNDGLFWNISTNRFENKSISSALGYTPVPTTRTLSINGTTFDLTTNRSWTIPTHNAVTLGTANGLSLSTQVLSLGLASSSTNGALSSTDWATFNSKQSALNGTGFVRFSGTTPSYITGTSSQFVKADGTLDSNTYLTSVTNISGYSGTLISEDNRTISPSELGANRLKFGFTSWANNNTSPYADFIHLRSYQDASGGSDNLIMFKKSGIGMRIWQQTYGSTTAYSTYKDIAFTDGTNATGTWGINISGNSSFSNTSSYSYFSDISNLAYSAYELNNNYTNWNSSGAVNNVVGMLGWKGYGNGYVIFDASAGTTPSGSICSQTDSDFSWTTAYPTLMGFDGISTYGVRVDRAYYADYADSANITFNNISSKTGGTGTYQTSGDFRASIFYDSNNTSFYLDPASTSMLNALMVGGSRVVTNNGGTWGINISGNANSANNIDGIAFRNGNSTNSINPNSITENGIGYVNSVSLFGQTDGALYSQAHSSNWNHQIFGDYRTGQLAVRGRNNGTLTAWRIILDSSNFTSYAASTSHTHTFDSLTSKTLGTGTYQTSGDFRASIFYDSNNTGYYVDPASTSNLLSLTVANTISGSINGNSATVSNITNNTGLVRNGLSAPGFIDGLTTNNFRTTLFGSTTNGYQISTARWNNVPAPLSGLNQYSTMIAWAGSDTQGFLAVDYNSPAVRIGGGNANNINWNRRVLLEDVWTNNKYFGSNGDIYGTVFYDANDSSRYLDPSSTGDSIRVSGDIVAYYSDERLKDKKGNIQNALEKVLSLNGFYYEPNNKAQELGYKKKLEVGVSAQEVETILPEIIKDAPIGQGYKTLDYGKLTPLLIEAIKEQQKQIDELKELVNKLITK
jgi:hypothetical protein